jgi:putative phosphoribosyl transferase
MRFHDRQHAGQLLGAKLEHLRASNPIVLGLTRGGIPVASEVARMLGAPLDLIVVRKMIALDAPESAVGAIAEGGDTFLVPETLRDARVSEQQAAALADREVAELARRVRLYRDEIPAPRIAGRTAIVVDDFLETGATARAAARAARKRGATRVVLAVPVLRGGTEGDLRHDLDELVSIVVTPPGRALTDSYEHLADVSDEEAIALLRRARAEWTAHAETRPGSST